MYFKVRNLAKDEEVVVSTVEELEEITGYDKKCFTEMQDSDKYFIKWYRVEAVEIDDNKNVYYKNLWRFNDEEER